MVFKKGHKINQGREPWNKGTKGFTKPNKSSFKKGLIPWNKGKHLTKEHKRKISNVNKGKTPWNKNKKLSHLSENHKKKISEALKGRKFSEEWKSKIGNAHRGKKVSEETKRKISKTRKRLFKEGKIISWFKGKHHSKESKRKMSEMVTKAYKTGTRKKRFGKLNPMYNRKGNKHPNWNEGSSFEPYSKSFNNIFKRRIRKRDNHICMICGIHKEKLKYPLPIHHINYNKKLTIPQNCISLCNSCHSKTNYNRPHWIKFFQSLLAKKYNYQYSEIGEVMLEVKKWQ